MTDNTREVLARLLDRLGGDAPTLMLNKATEAELCDEIYSMIKLHEDRAAAPLKAELDKSTDLDALAAECRAWQDKNFPGQNDVDSAGVCCEEAGEIMRVAIKSKFGIRPDTRGRYEDEIPDLLMAALALANRVGIDVTKELRRRNARRAALDFTKNAEGGEVKLSLQTVLTDGGDELKCLMNAAKAYRISRTLEGKATSRIEGIIEKLEALSK